MAEQKDVCSSSPMKTPKSQAAAEHHQQENVGSHQKTYLTSKGKEEAPVSWQEDAITFKIKFHAHQRYLEGANKTLCAPEQRERSSDTPQETEPDLFLNVWVSPVVAWVSSDLPHQQGLWLQQTWKAWCMAYILLQEFDISYTIELPSRQPTNWRTIKSKKFSHCCKISRTHKRFPNLGSWQKD